VTWNSFSSSFTFWSQLPKMAAASSMLSNSTDFSANMVPPVQPGVSRRASPHAFTPVFAVFVVKDYR